MRGYGGSLERKLRVIAIRSSATELVKDLSTQVSDYQIMFCAAATGIIRQSKVTLDDLSDEDLNSLYLWLVHQEREYKKIRFRTYA